MIEKTEHWKDTSGHLFLFPNISHYSNIFTGHRASSKNGPVFSSEIFCSARVSNAKKNSKIVKDAGLIKNMTLNLRMDDY